MLFACQKDDDLEVSTVEELESSISEQVEKEDLLSVSYCVVKDNLILHSGARGLADPDNNVAATDKIIYLIASISKMK
jgi:CubicO group peptidase (beta-lactamase class C family)